MRIVMISDTHNFQDQLRPLPEGDLLIHAGDLTARGTPIECEKALSWLGEKAKNFTHGAVVIAGNHDMLAEENPEAFALYVPDNVTYLNDSGAEIGGLKFWGSPITPWFHDWAFNRREHEIGKHWAMIPDDTDVLVTHGPPKGILDWVLPHQESVGCPQLLRRIEEVQPRLHVFGHLHEARNCTIRGPTTFVNASICDHKYRPINAPFIQRIGE